MPKYLRDQAYDAALADVDLADLQTVCSAYPTTYAEATGTFKLADVTLAAADIVLGDAAPDGRWATIAAKDEVPVDASGSPTHVALVRTTDTTIRAVTQCTGPGLTAGSTVDFPLWRVRYKDPE